MVANTQNGCTATFATTVLENTTSPAANAGPDALLHCNQPTANLNANAQAGLQYLWQTSGSGHIVQGSSSALAVIDQPGTYLLTVTNPANGCTATDSAVATEITLPAFDTELVQPDCHTPTGTIEFVSTSGGLAPYTYSFDGGTAFISDTDKAQLAPGSYQLVIKDQYGCTVTDEAVITEPHFPSVSLPAVYRIELGDSVQLVPQTVPAAPQIQSWAWSATPTLSCTNCPSPYATPFTGTEYQLTITDNNGCTATAATRVEVDIRRHIYVPNVFHPDGDAENNRFLIFGRGVVEIKDLSVFDRWGNMVWRGEHLAANDQSTGWDGNMRNKKVSPGVYVWQAVIVFPDGVAEIYSGDVTVIW
jgi:gliding motility-associated-like protein